MDLDLIQGGHGFPWWLVKNLPAMQEKVKSLSRVQLFATPWTVAYQALRSLSVHGIFQVRVLEWVAISFSRGFPNPGIEPGSPILQADALPSDPLTY